MFIALCPKEVIALEQALEKNEEEVMQETQVFIMKTVNKGPAIDMGFAKPKSDHIDTKIVIFNILS